MAAPLNTPGAPNGKNPDGLFGFAGCVKFFQSPFQNPISITNPMNKMCRIVNNMFTNELSLVLQNKNKLIKFSTRKLV
jgi:hypothetical protein